MELGNLWVLVLNSQARWHNFVFLMTFWPTKTNSSSVVIALHVQCSCSCVRQHEAVDVFVWFTRHESSTRGSLSAYKWIRQASITWDPVHSSLLMPWYVSMSDLFFHTGPTVYSTSYFIILFSLLSPAHEIFHILVDSIYNDLNIGYSQLICFLFALCYSEKSQTSRPSRWVLLYSQLH